MAASQLTFTGKPTPQPEYGRAPRLWGRAAAEGPRRNVPRCLIQHPGRCVGIYIVTPARTRVQLFIQPATPPRDTVPEAAVDMALYGQGQTRYMPGRKLVDCLSEAPAQPGTRCGATNSATWAARTSLAGLPGTARHGTALHCAVRDAAPRRPIASHRDSFQGKKPGGYTTGYSVRPVHRGWGQAPQSALHRALPKLTVWIFGCYHEACQCVGKAVALPSRSEQHCMMASTWLLGTDRPSCAY